MAFFNIISWLADLIGTRKMIVYKQLGSYEINKNTNKEEIKKFLLKMPNKVQLMINIDSTEYNYKTALIQRNRSDINYFFICYSRAYGMTSWEKIQVDSLIELLFSNMKESLVIDSFTLTKRAVEGKAFGEY